MFTSRLYQPQQLRVTQILDLYRRRPYRSEGFADEWPARTLVRGYFYSEDFAETIQFQFNPTDMAINKQNVWANRTFTGRMNADPIWIKGEVKTVQFQLTFNASAGAQTQFSGGRIYNDYKASLSDVISAQREQLPPRGTLDMVEAIEKLTYPLPDDISSPRFTNGVAVLNKRFNIVPTIDFVYGAMMLKCKITSMTYNHTAFDKNLNPINTTMDITLTVIEGVVVKEAPGTVVNEEFQASQSRDRQF